jgi:hypothetical protein
MVLSRFPIDFHFQVRGRQIVAHGWKTHDMRVAAICGDALLVAKVLSSVHADRTLPFRCWLGPLTVPQEPTSLAGEAARANES